MLEYFLVAGMIVCGLFIVIFGAVLYQLILQNGRILERLDVVEHYLEETSADRYGVEEYLGTLPVGVPAPPITLPDLSGDPRVLAEWRGQRVLLVFFDPNCAFSRRLLPSLVALASDPVPGRPTPVIVTTGDREQNRAVFDEAGFTQPVLLQTGMEVAGAYWVDGTPMSYLIEADGTVASELAAGVQATLILAGEMAAVNDATMTEHVHGSPTSGHAGVSRNGLGEGETAPVFRLPALDGGEMSLLDYRGKTVVLVFTDPECGPCDELAPRLKATRRASEVAVLLISRGDAESNRAMVDRHGLDLPLALQRHWEVSREYGIFAVPAAFHIDEWGVSVEDAAVGPEAVHELVSRVTGSAGHGQV